MAYEAALSSRTLSRRICRPCSSSLSSLRGRADTQAQQTLRDPFVLYTIQSRTQTTNELGVVEIKIRDFYFEISPADYHDEEANIPETTRKKKGINPAGDTVESRAHTAHMLLRAATSQGNMVDTKGIKAKQAERLRK